MQTILSLLGVVRPTPKLVVAAAVPATAATTEFDIAPADELDDQPFDEPPVPQVTATELWRMFDTNEADAEQRFAQRPVYVSGAVERVTREGPKYAIELSVSGAFGSTVRCRIGDANQVNVDQLRRGDLVKVVGRRVVREYGRVVLDETIVVADDLTALPHRPLR